MIVSIIWAITAIWLYAMFILFSKKRKAEDYSAFLAKISDIEKQTNSMDVKLDEYRQRLLRLEAKKLL